MSDNNEKPEATASERHSTLTGQQITGLLAKMEVSKGKFLRDSGLARFTAMKILRGDSDGDIPKFVDALLLLYMIDEESRTTDGPLLTFPVEGYDVTFERP